mgnify:CR=1 FL=1
MPMCRQKVVYNVQTNPVGILALHRISTLQQKSRAKLQDRWTLESRRDCPRKAALNTKSWAIHLVSTQKVHPSRHKKCIQIDTKSASNHTTSQWKGEAKVLTLCRKL